MTFTYLTPHFTIEEMACKGVGCCGGAYPMDRVFMQFLESLRVIVGVELRITSGFRCPTHNDAVQGSPDSYHTKGRAADLWSPLLSPEKLEEFAERVPAFAEGGIGIYDGWIHVDDREGGPSRWDGRTRRVA